MEAAIVRNITTTFTKWAGVELFLISEMFSA